MPGNFRRNFCGNFRKNSSKFPEFSEHCPGEEDNYHKLENASEAIDNNGKQ